MRKQPGFTLSIIVGLCLALFPSFEIPRAYVLKGPHILHLMTERLGKAKRLLVSQTLEMYDPSTGAEIHHLQETVRFFFPERFRSDTVSEISSRIHLVSNGHSITLMDGRITSENETRFDRYKDILLYNRRERLQERLATLGLDVSISSFGKYQGKPAFVIGTQYPAPAASELWIEKKTFKPVRWIFRQPGIDRFRKETEIRYGQWKKHESIWYPMVTEWYLDGRLTRKIKVDRIEVNPDFSVDLFAIDRPEAVNSQKAPAPETTSPADDINEIQQAIDEFKRIYQ